MRSTHPLEIAIGMEFYSTSFQGVGGRIKRRYEDFVVEEIDSSQSVIAADIPLEEPCVPTNFVVRGVSRKARNIHFKMQKMGLTTLDAVSLLASSLGLSRHLVTYAGLKDRRALTAQRISVPKSALDNLRRLNLSRIWIRDFTYSRRPINVGDLWGNRFSILVREIETPCERALSNLLRLQDHHLMNYFGIQRFGVSRPFSHHVGKAVIKGDFEDAIHFILFAPSEYELGPAADIRMRIREEGLSDTLVEKLPQDMRYERAIAKSLLQHPNNYQLAFSKIPPRIQTLFIHAYQSYLFNRILSLRFKEGVSISEPEPGDFLIRLDQTHTGRDDWLFVTEKNLSSLQEIVQAGEYGIAGIIPGYASKLPNSRPIDIVRRVLNEEEISLQEFRNAENSHLDSAGSLHLLSYRIPDITGSCSEDGLRAQFDLRKGSYATVVLRELMKNSPLNRA